MLEIPDLKPQVWPHEAYVVELRLRTVGATLWSICCRFWTSNHIFDPMKYISQSPNLKLRMQHREVHVAEPGAWTMMWPCEVHIKARTSDYGCNPFPYNASNRMYRARTSKHGYTRRIRKRMQSSDLKNHVCILQGRPGQIQNTYWDSNLALYKLELYPWLGYIDNIISSPINSPPEHICNHIKEKPWIRPHAIPWTGYQYSFLLILTSVGLGHH